jgi:hypothetical protein
MANLYLIRNFCYQKKLSITELASKINICERALRRMIFKNNLTVDCLEKISAELGRPIQEFFDAPLNDTYIDYINNPPDKFMPELKRKLCYIVFWEYGVFKHFNIQNTGYASPEIINMLKEFIKDWEKHI